MRHLKNSIGGILLLTLIISFGACKNKSTTETRDIQLLADTSAYRNNLYSDTAALVGQEEINTSKTTPITKSNTVKHSSSSNRSGTSGSSSTTTTTSNNNNSGTTNSTTTTQKRGWSKAAKGAVIGGAAGAVGGAIISKKVGGAAVGAAVGAAGGYIIGRDQDKQDGRVRRKQ